MTPMHTNYHPAWLVHRHGAPDCPAAGNVRKALAAVAEATVGR